MNIKSSLHGPALSPQVHISIVLVNIVRSYPVCLNQHDDVFKWKHFPRYCSFVRGIHRSPVNSPHKGQWRGALVFYPTLAREFQGFRVWGKFVFRTLELTDTPTNLANQVKIGHALDQSRSVQSRGPERAHQNNEPSWRSSRTDRRLSRQFWVD